MEKVKITQIKSVIGRSERQKRTMKALGLKKIRQSIEVEVTPSILGMLKVVTHLIAIEKV
ncbi:MAG TPA: 50S ribosomal protein L30 [Sphingobacterium sp.]|nr:50S ribosomal protein L30 [Sphingobacterium sp.]